MLATSGTTSTCISVTCHMNRAGTLFYLIMQVAARLMCPGATAEGSYGGWAMSPELYTYTWIECLVLGAVLANGNSDQGCTESVTLLLLVDSSLCVLCPTSVRRGCSSTQKA